MKKRNAPTWPLRHRIEVDWVDSCSNGTWASTEWHKGESHPTRCRTIGYLLEATDKKLVVAQSMSADTQHITDTIAIPRASVVRMIKVKGFRD